MKGKICLIAGFSVMASQIIAAVIAIISGIKGNDIGFYLGIGWCMFSLVVMMVCFSLFDKSDKVINMREK